MCLGGLLQVEQLTRDRQFHDVLIKAADRMLSGTVKPDRSLAIGDLIECGEYAHFGLLAWKCTGLPRHRAGGEAILRVLLDNFDEEEGYWNTAIEPEMHPVLSILKPYLSPVLRAAVARLKLKGKTIAEVSEHVLPFVMRGRRPQYSLGLTDGRGESAGHHWMAVSTFRVCENRRAEQ